jgi:hypothetical protein
MLIPKNDSWTRLSFFSIILVKSFRFYWLSIRTVIAAISALVIFTSGFMNPPSPSMMSFRTVVAYRNKPSVCPDHRRQRGYFIGFHDLPVRQIAARSDDPVGIRNASFPADYSALSSD